MNFRQNHISVVLVLLFLMVLVSGCQKEGSHAAEIMIPNEFSIEPIETITPDGRELILHIETLEEKPCKNATIQHAYNLTNNEIHIDLDGVVLPGNCYKPPSIIELDIPFGEIENREYSMDIFLLHSILNRGNLNQTEEEISIAFENLNGMVVKHQTVRRIPDNVVWGFARTNNRDFNSDIVNFLTDLELMCEPSDLKDGHYSSFDVQDGKLINFLPHPAFFNRENFSFKFEGPSSELRDLIDFHRNKVNGEAEFLLFDTYGNIY